MYVCVWWGSCVCVCVKIKRCANGLEVGRLNFSKITNSNLFADLFFVKFLQFPH